MTCESKQGSDKHMHSGGKFYDLYFSNLVIVDITDYWFHDSWIIHKLTMFKFCSLKNSIRNIQAVSVEMLSEN